MLQIPNLCFESLLLCSALLSLVQQSLFPNPNTKEMKNDDQVQNPNPPLHNQQQYVPPPHAFDREFNHSPDLIGPPPDEAAFITSMLSKENSGQFDPPGQVPDSDKCWVKRFKVWMFDLAMKYVDEFRLGYPVAYLAMVYFERFISLKWRLMKRKAWAIKLAGQACLLLAGKVEKAWFTVSAVANLPESDQIKRMELLVLDALEWMLTGLISPFDFMHFFIREFEAFPEGSGEGGEVRMRTAAFIFAAMKVNGTLEYRPSVVAAAATLAAMDPHLTKAAVEERISRSTVFNYGFTATAEQVHTCYALINELDPYREMISPTPEVQSPDRWSEDP